MLSTHIMQEVEAMCERVIMINKGKIVANETLTSLKERHKGSLEDIFKQLTHHVDLI
jgi:ABC-2 type transport system ATP-binding protein